MHLRLLILLFTGITLFACQESEQVKADLVLIHATVATVNPEQPEAEAVAIAGDSIIFVGTTKEALAFQGADTEVIDLEGRFLMPGFIEGHGHFSMLGNMLMNLNFLKSKSWEEIVAMVESAAKTAEQGRWIEGRGWHQEKWDSVPHLNTYGYPHHHKLSERSPYNPVVLKHASGHSLFANEAAMKAAGVDASTPDPRGGRIVRDEEGNPIGVFEERAMGLIMEAYNRYRQTLTEEGRAQAWFRSIELAQEECLQKGITSFQDAGSKFYELERYRQMAEKGQLDLRLWAMVRHPYEEMVGKLDSYPWIDLGGEFFTVRAIKSELDGALGSYGAWLLEPYNDKPDFNGQNTTPTSIVEKIAEMAMEQGMQLCVHAIGDKANRRTLDIFEDIFSENPDQEDLRWRIEHSQHLHPDDIPRFEELGVIAAMQGIHCTSDAPFVVKRLGEQRAREGAYPWRSLLDAGAVVTNGTDAPVEDVDPIESYYATVTRKRADGGEAFFSEQAMSREEALHSYTLANAYAAFEEDRKGSLEVGKLADLVVLSNNLLTCPEDAILETKVLMTIVGGEVKYQASE